MERTGVAGALKSTTYSPARAAGQMTSRIFKCSVSYAIAGRPTETARTSEAEEFARRRAFALGQLRAGPVLSCRNRSAVQHTGSLGHADAGRLIDGWVATPGDRTARKRHAEILGQRGCLSGTVSRLRAVQAVCRGGPCADAARREMFCSARDWGCERPSPQYIVERLAAPGMRTCRCVLPRCRHGGSTQSDLHAARVDWSVHIPKLVDFWA